MTLSTFKSFWCQVKLWTQTQVTPRSIPHCQCWIKNLSDLLSLQYKENMGKFAASNGRLKAKSFTAPDPHYRLALPRSPWAPSLTPTFLYLPRPHMTTDSDRICHTAHLFMVRRPVVGSLMDGKSLRYTLHRRRRQLCDTTVLLYIQLGICEFLTLHKVFTCT